MNFMFLYCTYTYMPFLLYSVYYYFDDIIYSCVSRPLAIVCTIAVYFVLVILMLPLTGPYAFCK